MQWPMPKDQVTADRIILSEVERRENYMVEMTQYPSLKQLVEQCVQDIPESRPVIKGVIGSLKNVNYNTQPHETDSVIEMCDSVSIADKRIIQEVKTTSSRIFIWLPIVLMGKWHYTLAYFGNRADK